MESNYNFFKNIFSRIDGLTRTDLQGQIEVQNSKNVSVTGNIFGSLNTYILGGVAFPTVENAHAISIRVDFSPAIAADKTERALLNIDFLERFIFACNRQGVIPTIRCYAFFSHLSSIRSRSDMSDYNQLILAEKGLFDKMLELKYHVKLIISLDIPVILTKWYGNLSDAILRMTDLADNANKVCENNNIEVVIDEINALNGEWILHDRLLIRALMADPVLKYSSTVYETDINVVRNAITTFDERFNYLSFSNYLVRKHLQAHSIGAFIKETVDTRVENLNQAFS